MGKDHTYFQDTWLSDDKYKDWLVSTGKNTQARCKRCKKTHFHRNFREKCSFFKCVFGTIQGNSGNFILKILYEPSKGILSYQIMCTFWRAVVILENTCNFRVIAVVSDGASCNRSFLKLHRSMSNIADADRTVNIYQPKPAYMFFCRHSTPNEN